MAITTIFTITIIYNFLMKEISINSKTVLNVKIFANLARKKIFVLLAREKIELKIQKIVYANRATMKIK
jgi:hypothetical protein